MEKTHEQMVHAAPAELMLNSYNIEKAIMNVFNYQTREEMSFEVQDAFDNIMAEVYDMRRNIKILIQNENQARLVKLTGKDRRYPDRQ
jgi:hypothetical protein